MRAVRRNMVEVIDVSSTYRQCATNFILQYKARGEHTITRDRESGGGTYPVPLVTALWIYLTRKCFWG